LKWQRIFSRLDLESGALIPRGYGFAYYQYGQAKVVFYPIPLNLLINLHRKIMDHIIGPSPPKLNRLLHRTYMKGRIDGYRECQRALQEEYERWRYERMRKREVSP
jgi:hypothetical protein